MNSCVTVITLTYNNFTTLYSSIDSVMSQDYPCIEYIIADDGSDVFPINDIQSYVQRKCSNNIIKFKIIHHEQNIGTVKNFNDAIKNSVGDYIIPLASDDEFYDNNVISRIVSLFELNHYDVICGSRLALSNDKIIGYMPHLKDQKIIKKWKTAKQQRGAFVGSRFRKMASGSAMYYRRNILLEHGLFDETYRLWEDGPFIERYTRQQKLNIYYDIPSIKYRFGGISTGKKSSQLMNDERLFNRSDRLIDLSNLKWFDRRTVQYDSLRAANEKMTFFQKLKYIDVLLRRKYYHISDIIGWWTDRHTISKYNKVRGGNHAGH